MGQFECRVHLDSLEVSGVPECLVPKERTAPITPPMCCWSSAVDIRLQCIL